MKKTLKKLSHLPQVSRALLPDHSIRYSLCSNRPAPLWQSPSKASKHAPRGPPPPSSSSYLPSPTSLPLVVHQPIQRAIPAQHPSPNLIRAVINTKHHLAHPPLANKIQQRTHRCVQHPVRLLVVIRVPGDECLAVVAVERVAARCDRPVAQVEEPVRDDLEGGLQEGGEDVRKGGGGGGED